MKKEKEKKKKKKKERKETGYRDYPRHLRFYHQFARGYNTAHVVRPHARYTDARAVPRAAALGTRTRFVRLLATLSFCGCDALYFAYPFAFCLATGTHG